MGWEEEFKKKWEYEFFIVEHEGNDRIIFNMGKSKNLIKTYIGSLFHTQRQEFVEKLKGLEKKASERQKKHGVTLYKYHDFLEMEIFDLRAEYERKD